MNQYRRGLFQMLALAILLVFGGTALHNLGQTVLEEEPISILRSLEFVTQTLTTVGYGQEAGWNHPLMYVFVIGLQLAGITIVFMSIPVVVTPWLETRLQTKVPTRYQGDSEHVLITEYSETFDSLIKEFQERGVPYVILVSEEEEARQIMQKGYSVMQGEARDPETLERAQAHETSTVILEGPDERNASVSLALRELASDHDREDMDIVALARDANRAVHLEQAGTRKVYYPREILGEALAEKALSGAGVSVDLDSYEAFQSYEVREFPLLQRHPFIGQTLNSVRFRDRFGVHLIGVWRMGSYRHPSPELQFQSNDVLVLVGPEAKLENLSDYVEGRSRWKKDPSEKDVMIIGYGHEGMAANRVLQENGIEPTIVNDEDHEDVDVVGDGMNESTLREAGIEDIDTVLITIFLDDASVMVGLMVQRLTPEAEILVQVQTASTVESAYRAGASYVQSLDQITNRMLVSEILGETFLDFELDIEFLQTDAGSLASSRLEELELTERFNVTLVAVSRDGETINCVDSSFRIEAGDELFLIGPRDQLVALEEEYGLEERAKGERSGE